MNQVNATALARHLREYAPRYFADLGQESVNVRLVSESKRTASTLYRFDVSTRALHHSLFVKAPPLGHGQRERANGVVESPDERPRLGPQSNPKDRSWLEYIALSAIHEHFSKMNDPRFGTIRIFDYLPDQQAIVMENVQKPTLRQLFLKENRLFLPFGSLNLRSAFRNAGAWLRAYHTLPKGNNVKVHHAQRTEFLESIINLTDYLARALDDKPFFRSIASRTTASALEMLPEKLPFGLRHGDYAMRNILVDHNNRITILDPLARWQTPIYEDIAYFLIRFETTWLQVLSQGLAFNPDRLTRYEREFLSGYFGQKSIPLEAIRLYEIQMLLDKWSARVADNMRRLAGKYAIIRPFAPALSNRSFRRIIKRLLQDTNRRRI